MSVLMCSYSHQNNNFTPVVGILCIDIAVALQKVHGNDFYSYVAASYVKYLESAGAKVIPIWINRPRSYYEGIMSKINGILLPGGAVFFNTKHCTKELHSDCVQSSKYIYEIAEDLNRKGQHFPLWGTCMGFQLMLTHSANVDDIRQDCTNMSCSLPLKFENDKVLSSSKLFNHINTNLKLKMATLPFGIHYHKYCVTKDDLEKYKIAKQWKVLACNEDDNGLEFISIVEHNSLPFFGSQIHPERVVFENFMGDDEFHHCLECFELAQYFAHFFVEQCSLNRHHFATREEELRHYISNFPVLNTAADTNHWQQCFLFRDDVDYPKETLKQYS